MTSAVKRRLARILGRDLLNIKLSRNTDVARNTLLLDLAKNPKVSTAINELMESIGGTCPTSENGFPHDPQAGDLRYILSNWSTIGGELQSKVQVFLEILLSASAFQGLGGSKSRIEESIRSKYGIFKTGTFKERKPTHGGEGYIGQPTPSDTKVRHETQKTGDALIPSNLSNEQGKGELTPSVHPDALMANQSLPIQVSIQDAMTDIASAEPTSEMKSSTQIAPRSVIADQKQMAKAPTSKTSGAKEPTRYLDNFKRKFKGKPMSEVVSVNTQNEVKTSGDIQEPVHKKPKLGDISRSMDLIQESDTDPNNSQLGLKQTSNTTMMQTGMGTGGLAEMGGTPGIAAPPVRASELLLSGSKDEQSQVNFLDIVDNKISEIKNIGSLEDQKHGIITKVDQTIQQFRAGTPVPQENKEEKDGKGEKRKEHDNFAPHFDLEEWVKEQLSPIVATQGRQKRPNTRFSPEDLASRLGQASRAIRGASSSFASGGDPTSDSDTSQPSTTAAPGQKGMHLMGHGRKLLGIKEQRQSINYLVGAALSGLYAAGGHIAKLGKWVFGNQKTHKLQIGDAAAGVRNRHGNVLKQIQRYFHTLVQGDRTENQRLFEGQHHISITGGDLTGEITDADLASFESMIKNAIESSKSSKGPGGVRGPRAHELLSVLQKLRDPHYDAGRKLPLLLHLINTSIKYLEKPTLLFTGLKAGDKNKIALNIFHDDLPADLLEKASREGHDFLEAEHIGRPIGASPVSDIAEGQSDSRPIDPDVLAAGDSVWSDPSTAAPTNVDPPVTSGAPQPTKPPRGGGGGQSTVDRYTEDITETDEPEVITIDHPGSEDPTNNPDARKAGEPDFAWYQRVVGDDPPDGDALADWVSNQAPLPSDDNEDSGAGQGQGSGQNVNQKQRERGTGRPLRGVEPYNPDEEGDNNLTVVEPPMAGDKTDDKGWGMLRPSFTADGANIVADLNEDKHLQLINRLTWGAFNNYTWEANAEPDNALNFINYKEYAARFSGELDKDNLLPAQSRQAIEYNYMNDKVAYDIPKYQQYEGDCIVLDTRGGPVTPLTSDETESAFHDVYLDPWASIPYSNGFQQFTQVEGSQLPDSMLMNPHKNSGNDWPKLSMINRFISTTLS